MRRAFKEKVNNFTRISPAVLDMIYKELTLDAATSAHPDTQERLRLIFLGETELIADLRHINPGGHLTSLMSFSNIWHQLLRNLQQQMNGDTQMPIFQNGFL